MTRRRLLCGTVVSLPALGFDAWPALAGTNAAHALLVRLCDIVLPDTSTPGASAAGVPDFLLFAFPHRLFGGDAQTVLSLLQHLDARTGGGGFLTADSAQQLEIVTALDRATLSRQTPPPMPLPAQGSTAPAVAISAPVDSEAQRLWRIVKGGIVTSFFTSESGGSRTLTYDLVPGRYDADVGLRADPYLSNFWIENIF